MKNSIFKSIFFFIAAAFTLAGCNVTSHTAQLSGINFIITKHLPGQVWEEMKRVTVQIMKLLTTTLKTL